MQERIELLQKSDIFSGLKEAELANVAGNSSILKYGEGDVIFREGGQSDGIYIVKSGEILIAKNYETDERMDLAQFIRGETFGELDFFENAPMSATALAQTDAELLVFPGTGTTMDKILNDNPEISAGIMRKLLVRIAGRIRRTNRLISEKSQWIQDLKRQLFRDKLTGLYNRTFLEDDFATLLPEYGDSTIMIMVKPDNFKPINDTFGHDAGDRTLRLMADTLNSLLRENDIAVRYRGDEYAAILPDTNLETGCSFAETIKERMTAINLADIVGDSGITLTFSLGVAAYPSHAGDNRELTKLSFDKMFEARDSGGDAIVTAG